ncbi:MAG: hypothetical protein MEQ74_11930 [Paracoccus sp.]|nr:hypothetical protein [Paracoccus sp. (in: a-proteobacteria)]
MGEPQSPRTSVLQFAAQVAAQQTTAALTVIALREDGSVTIQTEGDVAMFLLAVEQAKHSMLANLGKEG